MSEVVYKKHYPHRTFEEEVQEVDILNNSAERICRIVLVLNQLKRTETTGPYLVVPFTVAEPCPFAS